MLTQTLNYQTGRYPTLGARPEADNNLNSNAKKTTDMWTKKENSLG